MKLNFKSLVYYLLPLVLMPAGIQICFAQGFVNTDFEDATVVVNENGISTAILPGWVAYYGPSNNPTQAQAGIGYDTLSLGGAGIFLYDSKTPPGTDGLSLIPIDGSYSIFLQGSIPYAATSASIGQTGTISTTARSLIFLGSNIGIQISFNGQNLPYSLLQAGIGYYVYGADVSAYAGQTGQLLFTAPPGSAGLIDDIYFSSSSVPEPSEYAFSALGTFLLGLLHKRNSFIRL